MTSNKIACATALVLGLFHSQPTLAEITDSPNIQPAPDSRVITTSGVGRVQTKPDQALVVLGVKTWCKDLRTGYADSEKNVSQVIAIAGKYKVTPANVQTSELRITPSYNSKSSSSDKGKPVGYYIQTDVSVILNDLNSLPAFITDAVENGANDLQRIDFELANSRPLRDQARILALKAAKEKASAMAAVFNAKVGKPIIIREDGANVTGLGGGRWSYAANTRVLNNNLNLTDSQPDSERNIAAGQLRVDSSVTVTFELID